MTDNLYKSPTANLESEPTLQSLPPSIYSVTGWLILASIGTGLLLFAIEYLIDSPIPGSNSASIVVPPMVVGSHYGRKRGLMFTPTFRHKCMGLWFLASFVLGIAMISLLAPELSELFASGSEFSLFMIVFFVASIIAYAVSYYIFRHGEKLGIKKHQSLTKARTQ